MTINEQRLSELADGELSADDSCRLLLEILDDEDSQEKFREYLEMRKSLSGWRCLTPGPSVRLVSAGSVGASSSRATWRRLMPLCTAALIGGLIVLAGVWGFRDNDSEQAIEPPGQTNLEPVVVTAREMNEVAQVFRFHQSVAGPLKWYAADENTVLFEPAESDKENRRHIAVRLRIRSGQSGDVSAKDYVIVCREREPANITLPADGTQVRVSLIPTLQSGQVNLEYVIEWGRQSEGANVTALLGQRDVALKKTPLGQMVVKDHLINFDADAWPLEGEKL